MPDTLTAYNQSGFLPFALDLNNVDDLGICSRFYAELPVTDVFFTEVGKYAPLSAKRSLRAADAYLLYLDVRYVIQRGDLLRAANGGVAPDELMGGYYALVGVTPGGADAVYRRTPRSTAAFRHDPRLFRENLVHPSYITSAAVDGQPLALTDVSRRFAFLRDGTGRIDVAGRRTIDLTFGAQDIDVYELDVNGIRASAAVSVRLILLSADGQERMRETLDLPAREDQPRLVSAPPDTRANRLRIELVSPMGQPAQVDISDLRVQGQTPILADYIRRTLRFQ